MSRSSTAARPSPPPWPTATADAAPRFGPELAVEAVPPGAEPTRQIAPTGRYFAPRATGDLGLRIGPGDTYTLRATFTPTADDPAGRWRACEIHDSFREARGPCVAFTVAGGTAP